MPELGVSNAQLILAAKQTATWFLYRLLSAQSLP